MAKPIVVTSSKPMSQADMLAELTALREQNAKLKSAQATADGYRFVVGKRSFLIKVSQKGAMSIYGLGRFPVTLYKQQAVDLFHADCVAHVLQFIGDNSELLTDKPEKETNKSE